MAGKVIEIISIIIIIAIDIQAQIYNVAEGKPTKQLGGFDDHDSYRAVDGRINQNLVNSDTCAHPTSNNEPAWWRVDLAGDDESQQYIIINVTIYFRNECCSDRIPGTSILVGNDPEWQKQIPCANITKNRTIQTLSCALDIPIRYLTIRPNMKKSLGYCEVIVYGYPYVECKDGWWGDNCSTKCDCKYSCNDITEDCKDCSAGNFGIGCVKKCNCNDTTEVCDLHYGFCQSGCQDRYIGSACSTCKAGFYGEGCHMKCNCKIITEACSIQNGSCQSGCQDGYEGQDCQMPCKAGFFGEGCHMKCNCKDIAEACTIQDGSCRTGCQDGYEGKNCQMPCTAGYFGEGCHMKCNCKNITEACGRQDGSCQSGCQDGYEGQDCQMPCKAGFYGTGCGTKCNCKNITEACGRQNGSCQSGCRDGYEGMNCLQQISTQVSQPPDSRSSKQIGLFVGVSLAVLVLIIVIIVIALLSVRRYKKRRQAPPASHVNAIMQSSDNIDCLNVARSPEKLSGNTNLLPAIKVKDLGKYIQTRKNQADAFKKEFKTLPTGSIAKCEVGEKPGNKIKHRFQNIKAYDHSRVVLGTVEQIPNSDYINANYITGYGGLANYYIASQGPKDVTVADTWRMIWQTKSNRIVMLTNCFEAGMLKCEQYWPDDGSATYGQIEVTLVSMNTYATYVIRIFNVEYQGESRMIRQFHFTSWPDHGVPKVALELLEFIRRVKLYDEGAIGPLIIHCSAGIGRTGTYIAIDYCIQQGQIEDEVNIWAFTHQMRAERVNMIQTLDQYIFVYDAIHEALLSGETEINASEFRKEYVRLCTPDHKTNESVLSKQFQTLELFKPDQQEDIHQIALEPENRGRNRSRDIVPCNAYITFLSTAVSGTTSYINAVFVDGPRKKSAYIVTQMPLPETTVDLWRLVHDHNSTSIVMLDPMEETYQESEIYWPKDIEQSLEFGPLKVTLTAVDTKQPHVTMRDFKVSDAKTNNESMVKQFQLTSWTKDDAFPRSRRALLEAMATIESWQKQMGNGPIIIHCTDGASRCGLFVSSLYAVEQLKVDQEVDVFRAVKQVRIPRPQFIQDLDQYKFVHEMVLEYMDRFGDYSNFT